MTHTEREARRVRALEGLVQAAALMLDASEEKLAAALIVTSSALMDMSRLGGERAVDRAFDAISKLRAKGILRA